MKMEILKHKLDIQLFAEETETAETVTSETEEGQTQPDEAKTFTEKTPYHLHNLPANSQTSNGDAAPPFLRNAHSNIQT